MWNDFTLQQSTVSYYKRSVFSLLRYISCNIAFNQQKKIQTKTEHSIIRTIEGMLNKILVKQNTKDNHKTKTQNKKTKQEHNNMPDKQHYDTYQRRIT